MEAALDDRISEVLNRHLDELTRAIALMEGGKMSTRKGQTDTTQETIGQYRIWKLEIGAALLRHETRNA